MPFIYYNKIRTYDIVNEWITGTIKQIKYWKNNKFSLIMHAPIDPFIAGQFTKLALNIHGKKIFRAYSYVNAPNNKNLEFYLIKVATGILSIALYSLKEGDTIFIKKKSSGFLTINHINPCKNLWMIATGTAIGPYLSILTQGDNLDKFENIILVYAVKFYHDINYSIQIEQLKIKYNGKLKIQIILSQENNIPNTLYGRIPELLINGSLENYINCKLNYKNTHIMLCGNPNMVYDTKNILKNKYNMSQNIKNRPGNISTENYW